MKLLFYDVGDVTLIAAALRVAQAQHIADAEANRQNPRIAEQFRRQVDDANRIASSIEQRGEKIPGEIRIAPRHYWCKARRPGTCYVGPSGWPCSKETPGAVRLPNEFEDV